MAVEDDALTPAGDALAGGMGNEMGRKLRGRAGATFESPQLLIAGASVDDAHDPEDLVRPLGRLAEELARSAEEEVVAVE